MDLDALNKQWSRRVERIAKLVETVPGVDDEDRAYRRAATAIRR